MEVAGPLGERRASGDGESVNDGSFGRGFSDAAGQRGPLTRIDHRKELDLSGRSLSYTAGLANTYVALTSLDISNNAVTRLDSLPAMLVHLNASHNLLRCISGLEHNYDLQTLNLAHNSITRLGGLDHCTNLVELSLQSNEIRVVSDLECNLLLERIDLSHNGIPAVEALRTLSLNTKVTWMCLKGNPCARNTSHRHKLTGLLPNLVMLDDMRMPKSGYRASSPASRQAPRADGTPPHRNASPASVRSSSAKGPLRGAGGDGPSSVSSSVDQGSVSSWAAAGAAGGALGPWNSTPAAAPVRTFGSMAGAAVSGLVAQPISSRKPSYAALQRPPSPGPLAAGKRAPAAAPLVGSHASLNTSKMSAASDGSGTWIPPNSKNASPAVVAALGHAGVGAMGGRRGRDASPSQASALRSSRQDMKFARMAAGLASNPSGLDPPDAPDAILQSLSASPTSRSSRQGSPQKGDARMLARYADEGGGLEIEPRHAGLGGRAEGDIHSNGADRYAARPLRTRDASGGATVSAVASEMNGKIERLYECHVRSMDVIAQQQALLATLHRDVRIVKSAVTYINAKINGQDPALVEAERGASPQGKRVAQMAEQLQGSLADLVEARGALVTAMHWADSGQQNKGNQDFLNFKHQLESAGLLSSPTAGLADPRNSGGGASGDRASTATVEMRGGEGHQNGNASRGEGQSPASRRAQPARGSSSVQASGAKGEAADFAGGFTSDSPPPARRPSVETASASSPGGSGGGRRVEAGCEAAAFRDLVTADNSSGKGEFARPPSVERSPAPAAALQQQQQQQQQRITPSRERSAPGPLPHIQEGPAGARPPSPARAGGSRRGGASPGKGISPARSRGGGVGGVGGSGQEWTDELLRALEEVQDETADELVTTRLALRNMVKLSRMPGCSKDKVDEYRRLLEECAVMSPYQLPPAVSEVEHLEGQQGAPEILQSVMDAVRDLNLAKTALGKMMALMESPDVGRAQLEHYAAVIEETLLAQADS